MYKSGFLFIDKPKGISSFDVIKYLRKITQIKKIGHAGTLDPFASGLLIVGIGKEATKLLENFLKKEKIYLAEIEIGKITETYDTEGKIIFEDQNLNPISLKEIKKTLSLFVGELYQVPPKFSAKKINGKRAYEFARAGKKIKLSPQKVKIFYVKILKYKWPILKIETKVSSGCYIRSLAYDIGQKLRRGAYLKNLKRIQIGKINLKEAVPLKKLNSSNWQNFLFNCNV
ncbi:tRNA pseudouridine(55) synthase TruB [bacterium]|nr:tRNA pseudouridine(55) synthase TruB [bacterium]